MLFVTVDPDRDTLPMLKAYADAFRAADGGLARHRQRDCRPRPALSRRLCVKPPTKTHPYKVTHSRRCSSSTARQGAAGDADDERHSGAWRSDMERLIEG